MKKLAIVLLIAIAISGLVIIATKSESEPDPLSPQFDTPTLPKQ